MKGLLQAANCLFVITLSFQDQAENEMGLRKTRSRCNHRSEAGCGLVQSALFHRLGGFLKSFAWTLRLPSGRMRQSQDQAKCQRYFDSHKAPVNLPRSTAGVCAPFRVCHTPIVAI